MSSLHRYGSLIEILSSFGVLSRIGFGIIGVAELEIVGVIVIVPPVVLDEELATEETTIEELKTELDARLELELRIDELTTDDELIDTTGGGLNTVITVISTPHPGWRITPVELPRVESSGII